MDALELKSRTEIFLSNEDVPVNTHLPKIEEITEFSFASVIDIRKRAVALSYVLARAFGAPYELVHNSINAHNLLNIFTPMEVELLENPNPPKEIYQQFQLNIEALWVLSWVLDLISQISHWQLCGNNLINLIPKPGDNPSEFINSKQMRNYKNIYEEADLLFRIHWASREAYLTGKPEPTGLPEYVIEQRHKAINWVSYNEVVWDEVDTST